MVGAPLLMPAAKSRRWLVVLIGLCAAGVAFPGATAVWAADSGCGVIRYSTNPDYPPFDWDNGDGYSGAAVALLARVAPAELRLVPVKAPWPRAQKMAAEGEIDLLVAIRPTTERRQVLEFTESRAFKNPIAVFSRKAADFEYRQWSDLVGRRGGVARGDSFEEDFDKYMKEALTVEEAPSLTSNLQKLAMGRIDYVLASYYATLTRIRGTEYEGIIVGHPVPVTKGDIGFAFSKKSPCRSLVGLFSTRLREAEANGTQDSLLTEAIQLYARRDRNGGIE